MKVAGDWLSAPDLQRLMAAVDAAGQRIYVVGGAVRNALMGRAIADVDLATSARPDQIMQIAADLGFRCLPTGLDHGTLTVLTPAGPYEVTTFRRDIATDGRHAAIAFTQDLAQDAARRDFTINALYADAGGQVTDPAQGLDDIRAGRLRFVGDARARIAEDYLRILRYFRFSAVYGNSSHGFDPEILAQIGAHLDGLDRLSKERIGQEMRKLLAAIDPAPALSAMSIIGVLPRILSGAEARFIAPLVHFEGGHPCHWLARLALLGGQDVAGALRLSRAEAGDLAKIRAEMGDTLTPAALGWRHGAALGGDMVLARAALLGLAPPHGWSADVTRGAQAICPISAADFMPTLSGPSLGAALQRATRRWLDGDLQAGKGDLLQG